MAKQDPDAWMGQTESAGLPSLPVCLDSVEADGAVKAGRRPARMILIWEDGTQSSYALPLPAAPSKDWAKTKVGRAILSVMADEGRPMKGGTIAKLAACAYSGSFRQALKGLEDQGEIHRDREDLYVLA